MKYIRAKNENKEESILECFERDGKLYSPQMLYGDFPIALEEGDRMADTIPELCDYVFYDNVANEVEVIKPLPLETPWENLMLLVELGYIKDVKLAIRNEKGIIFVADVKENKVELRG